MTHFFSRMRLSQNPSTEALKMLIDPENRALAMDAHHRLIWSAFAGKAEDKRDFLWRTEEKGAFIVFSNREPSPSPLFAPYEIKPYAPNLRVGDKLTFVLRVNATKTRPEKYAAKVNGKTRNRRVDIVMHALKDVASGEERNAKRMSIAQEVGSHWLTAQGEKHGFAVHDCHVVDYSVQVLPDHRGVRKGQPQFGILEMTGEIEVQDPAKLVEKLFSGFGRAKAFGCGLMLVKRV